MSSSSFTKRQKERARQEKQRAKAERRVQRKQEKGDTPGGGPPIDFSAMHHPEVDAAEEEPGTAGQTDGPDA
jgi:hypothetical protein